MPKGHAWNLTADRLKLSLKMLNKQHTVSSIAIHFGIKHSVFSAKLVECGVDAAAIRNSGRLNMKAMVFTSVMNIKDDAKRADAGLKFLTQYPVDVDDAIVAVDDTEDIKREILNELSK